MGREISISYGIRLNGISRNHWCSFKLWIHVNLQRCFSKLCEKAGCLIGRTLQWNVHHGMKLRSKMVQPLILNDQQLLLQGDSQSLDAGESVGSSHLHMGGPVGWLLFNFFLTTTNSMMSRWDAISSETPQNLMAGTWKMAPGKKGFV